MNNKIEINGERYIKMDSIVNNMESPDGLEYVIVRTRSAGVFAGYLKSKEGKEVTLLNVRRIWYWSGACSLSQLAMEGVKNPDECKFPCEVNKMILTEVIEILYATEQARLSVQSVKVWEI